MMRRGDFFARSGVAGTGITTNPLDRPANGLVTKTLVFLV
jgi:hypothetical protein